jgi:hypothetical protein
MRKATIFLVFFFPLSGRASTRATCRAAAVQVRYYPFRNEASFLAKAVSAERINWVGKKERE